MDFTIDSETTALLERFRRILHEDVVPLEMEFAKKSSRRWCRRSPKCETR